MLPDWRSRHVSGCVVVLALTVTAITPMTPYIVCLNRVITRDSDLDHTLACTVSVQNMVLAFEPRIHVLEDALHVAD
jgi:hypothetical protein